MIGVGIVSFNRPYYLRRLLKSLMAQTELDNAEFHLLQDGAVNMFSKKRRAQEFDIGACVKLFDQARLPSKLVHRQEHNVGVGINQREGIGWLSETYERIMIIEDDVLLSPHWLRLARILFDEMETQPDVFGFSPGFRRMCDMGDSYPNMGYMEQTKQHLWTECFTAQNWWRIQEHMAPFYALIADCDYNYRPRETISALHLGRGAPKGDTSQDWARVVAIELSGMQRMQCTVNRGFSIGRTGINFNNSYYEGLHLGEQAPYIFDDDATREGFEWLVPQN